MKNIFVLFMIFFLASCGGAILNSGQSLIGMTFSEFENFSVTTKNGKPIAVTSSNKVMIYYLPYRPEVYYWFEKGRLTKITERVADEPRAWEQPIAIPQ